MRAFAIVAAVAAFFVAGPSARADVIRVSYGAAGAQTASGAVLAAATTIGTESFDTQSGSVFTTDFGTGGIISGTYSGAVISNADRYGGAGGSGRYADALGGSAGYSIKLTTSGVAGVNYFGYWLSALDSGNLISFKRNGTVVGTFSSSDLVAALGSCSSSNAYCGNPTSPFRGQDSGEAFAFVNFVDTSGFFDEIDFSESPNVGNYESDNHTVGYCANASACISGTTVPEPIPLAVIGVGLLGLALLRVRQKQAR